MRADKNAKGDSYIKFLQNGRVYVSIDSGRNTFEMKLSANMPELDGLREQFVEEAAYVTGVIEELRQAYTMPKQ